MNAADPRQTPPRAAAAPGSKAITRSSKSNLAMAFVALPPERREAITTFYAFCRLIDDIADEPGLPLQEKERRLNDWKRAVHEAFEGEPPLAAEVRALTAKYKLRENWLLEIIQGCQMDLKPVCYATIDDLRLYCYRVASVVGLVSIEIFGYTNPDTRWYAVDLGYALQMTNIIRDVAGDLRNGGRIYLPLDDLARFGITPEELTLRCNAGAGAWERGGAQRFRDLMNFEARRAQGFFDTAIAELAPEDRRSMAAAEIMRLVYSRLLSRMKRDGFRVFERDYKLSKPEKLAIIAWVLLFGR